MDTLSDMTQDERRAHVYESAIWHYGSEVISAAMHVSDTTADQVGRWYAAVAASDAALNLLDALEKRYNGSTPTDVGENVLAGSAADPLAERPMGTTTTTLDVATDAEEILASAGVSISDKLEDMGIASPLCSRAFVYDAIHNLIELAMMDELDTDWEAAEAFVLTALDLVRHGTIAR